MNKDLPLETRKTDGSRGMAYISKHCIFFLFMYVIHDQRPLLLIPGFADIKTSSYFVLQ